MYEAQIGLSDWPKCIYSCRLIFLNVNSLNAVWNWWFWCCSYQLRRLLRTKPTPVQTDAVPRTVGDHRLFQKVWIHASRHVTIDTDGEEETGQSWIERSHWVADICFSRVNFHLTFNLNWWQAVFNQFRVFDVTHVELLVKTRDFPDLKINTIQ